MNIRTEWKSILIIIAVFLAFFYMPFDKTAVEGAVMEALHLAQDYAREHVILCLIPAFFIAGAIAVFLSQQSVIKYLGAGANKIIAYAVASVSGSVLAVCSCTVLPLFAGIHRMGAGIGPATAFLYSGPAINIMAIILTARVLGIELGIARALGAIFFSVIIGLSMHIIFRNSEDKDGIEMAEINDDTERPAYQNLLFFASMIAILVFANWGSPDSTSGFWYTVFNMKWILTSISGLFFAGILVAWFGFSIVRVSIAVTITVVFALIFHQYPMIPFAFAALSLAIMSVKSGGERETWFDETWGFAKQIMPLLFAGVLVAGFLLGRPGHESLIPSEWISSSVGDNSIWSNLFASVVGAFMYFATLTEVPILQGLIGNGMDKGPALALLLAGPALSLPNMLVIRSVIGTKKTIVFIILVVTMATVSGLIYGSLF